MWDDAKQMNALAATLALLASLGLAAALVTHVVRQSAFAFSEVVVSTPLHRANAAHLEAVIRAELTGTFFTMDLARARDALNRVPWVRDAGLRRQWPNRLEVTIEEHEPLARFNDNGFVNTRGEVFSDTEPDTEPEPFITSRQHYEQLDEQKRKIADALNQLPPKCKEVFLLVKLHGMSYKQAA